MRIQDTPFKYEQMKSQAQIYWLTVGYYSVVTNLWKRSYLYNSMLPSPLRNVTPE